MSEGDFRFNENASRERTRVAGSGSPVYNTGEDGAVDRREGAEPVVAGFEEMVDKGLTAPD